MPQVAFFVSNTTRLCIQPPDDIRDRGHVRLRFYGNPRSVTLDDFYRHCKIEIWDGEAIGGPGQEVDKIRWTHTRDERFQHLTLEEEIADGVEHPFCADGHPSEYHDYTFSFRGRDEVEYLPGQRQEIVLSCGKTLKPNNVEAWYRRQREEKKDQKVDSHFDLLVGGLQGDTDSLTKLGKSHREIDAEFTQGMLRYARSRPATDLRPLLQPYARYFHSSLAGVRSQAETCLRHLEETEGRVVYREQQEALLRTLGQFNHKHLAMVMKAIGKRLNGYHDELSVYGRMFRASLMDHWKYEDIRAIWTEVVREYQPTRSQVVCTTLQTMGRDIKEEDITESYRIFQRDCNEIALREQTEPGTGFLPGPMSEKVKTLKGKILPFPQIIDEITEEQRQKILRRAEDERCGGVNPYRLGREAYTALMREYAMKHGQCVVTAQQGVKDQGVIIVDWDGEHRYTAFSALCDVARIHGISGTPLEPLRQEYHARPWHNMNWQQCLEVPAFSEFCKDYPDIAASAKRLWESNRPQTSISDEQHDAILKEVKENDYFELSMMPDVGNDADHKAYMEYYKAEHAGKNYPPADGGPEPMYPPGSEDRLMTIYLAGPLGELGEKTYALLGCGKHECDYKDSPFHQTLEVKIKGITLADRQSSLDILDGKLRKVYRYQSLSRVSGDSFRYERCEELEIDDASKPG